MHLHLELVSYNINFITTGLEKCAINFKEHNTLTVL